MDRFYTPDALASAMVRSVRSRRPSVVADFAAGDGRLLVAAGEQWPDASVVAVDIHRPTVLRLAQRYKAWVIVCADFLKARAFTAMRQLTEGGFDVVLLNPPFSSRGGARCRVEVKGRILTCSRALAFVLRSLQLVTTNGEVVAILPVGSLSSQKDAEAWELIRRLGVVTVVSKNGHRTFEGCYPKTALVHIQRRTRARTMVRDRVRHEDLPTTDTIVRGRVPVYTVVDDEKGTPLIHSTSLRDGVVITSRTVITEAALFCGPAVLLPRVGRPDRRKVCVLPANMAGILTDCVFAIRCGTHEDARDLQAAIRRQWRTVEKLYKGTCAPYLTIRDLARFIGTLKP